MSHIFGLGELCLGNTLGWESWLATPADALALLPEVAPHVFMSVPAYWEKLARGVLAGAPLARALPGRVGWELRLVVLGGLRILERIEAVGYDVFRHRPTLGRRDWLRLGWRALTFGRTA
ncbi:MAG: hypothetical protein ACLGH2_14320, partial [Gammaproteobacteria bacterium]